MSKIIALTGGIGSGKSVVSKILTTMGYNVYDSDSEAKKIMNESTEIKDSLKSLFNDDIISNGIVDKIKLAKYVFANNDLLRKLNSIVHPAVRANFIEWTQINEGEIHFIETAILYESRLNTIVDEIWTVTAPTEIRIARVMKRNSLDEESVKMRIASQHCNDLEKDNTIKVIINDDITPVIPQVIRHLENVK